LKTAITVRKGFRKFFMVYLVIAAMGCVSPAKVRAYVMPAEQVIGFMAVKFSKIKTLVITQSTYLVNQDDQKPESVIKETLWLKAPGFLYSEIESETEAQGTTNLEKTAVRVAPDMAFRRLFMGNSGKALMLLLSTVGVNLDSVWYTRLDGVIAYQIGDRYDGSPKLLIEKERFLPLLISYRVAGDSAQKIVTVRFDEYRKLAEGWYPYRITYSVGEEILERYSVIDLKVNLPIEPSFFVDRGAGARPVKDFEYSHDEANEDRLRDVIRLLQEKYQ
jgi:hypothetical protein